MDENTPPCPKLGTKHMPHRFLHYEVIEDEDGVVIKPIPVTCDGSPDYFED